MDEPLPETIYVIRDCDSRDPENPWLLADEEPRGFATQDKTVRVGVYKLVGHMEVINSTVVVDAPEEAK